MKLSDGVFTVWTTSMLLGIGPCISDVILMSMVDFGLRLVCCVLESVCHAVYMLSSIFVCLD